MRQFNTMMAQLNALFTMILVCDRALTILDISSGLQQHMPALVCGTNLLEVFEFNRPASIKSVEDIEQSHHALFLLISRDARFALRGQMICTSLEGEDRVIFLGSPWLVWLNTYRPDLQLTLQDFSAADAQMDQLFYISTERQMVGDLEKLNAQLLCAKQAVEDAQTEKNAFYAQMSHEMRTPLNGVASALALLEQRTLPTEVKDLVNMASHATSNLMHVINYVLDVSQLETNDFSDQAENFALMDVFTSVLDIVRPHTLGKKLALTTTIDAQLPQRYYGFKTRLHQALLNLVSNAAKFTEHGTIHIQASQPQKNTVR